MLLQCLQAAESHSLMLLLLLNLTPWRRWTHDVHLDTPALTVLAERQSSLQRKINLLEVMEDDVLSTTAWPAAMTTPICRWRIEQVDNSGRQNMTEPWNTRLNGGVEDAQLASPPAGLLSGHKIGPVHPSMVRMAQDSKSWKRGTRDLWHRIVA